MKKKGVFMFAPIDEMGEFKWLGRWNKTLFVIFKNAQKIRY